MAIKPIPDGYHTLTPSIAVEDASRAIDFYGRAFGATERYRFAGPDGKIMHAEIQIGDSVMVLSDPFPQSPFKAPNEIGGTTGSLLIYVDDADAAFEQAVGAGATVTMPLGDMFWGDRYGIVTDPFGHAWQIATHKEDLAPEEIMERGKEAMAGMG